MKGVKIIVHGRVQGVFFRASCQKEAQRYGLRGFVKNLSDGSVEILASGEEGALMKLISWSRKGPEMSLVEKVEIADWDALGCPESFIINR